MSKKLLITEKPSVAMEFAKVIGENGQRKNGYIESQDWIITWCVGHLVTMSYPEKYDENLKLWRLDTLPFIPKEWKYEIIKGVENQFEIIKGLMQREDVETIYNAGDSGREGEYIQRLVLMMAHPDPKVKVKRVWIDSQTEEEIRRGINEAKDSEEYDSLSDSAYLRAKEDYLIGINFSRMLSIIYGRRLAKELDQDKVSISVGRVMTCVLGMVVEREREIRNFKKIPFYKIECNLHGFQAEWKVSETSKKNNSPELYNEFGFKKRPIAEKFIGYLLNSENQNNIINKNIEENSKLDSENNESNGNNNSDIEKYMSENPKVAIVEEVKKSKQKENAPLLFNLAEIQNECTKRFKIKPDETLEIIQNLYEKKLVTYPRTDARVLSTAVAKVITQNLNGIAKGYKDDDIQVLLNRMKEEKYSTNLVKTKYVNDSKITDHYAIIPTGQGYENLTQIPDLQKQVYNLIVRRFIAIFYPAAEYNKLNITIDVEGEKFYASTRVCINRGYLDVLKSEKSTNDAQNVDNDKEKDKSNSENQEAEDNGLLEIDLKKGQKLEIESYEIKESETNPPNRYNSGSIILAMENAGKLIEDEELREQIKGAGIGTSATRAEIIKKLEKIQYISINNKTQIITPTTKGESIYDIVYMSMPDMLNPKLTASWEKGLDMVAKKEIKSNEFMEKLEKYINEKFDKLVLRR